MVTDNVHLDPTDKKPIALATDAPRGDIDS